MKQIIDCCHGDKIVQVAAFEVVPGLFVHEDTTIPGLWVVSHGRSGSAVTETNAGPEHAAFLAHRCAGFADWTLSGKEIRQAVGPYGDDLYDLVPRPSCPRVVSAERQAL